MLPINKIYIDSRHRTPTSASNSDFEIQLKETINLPEGCCCCVSDVVLRNTITTIEDINQNIYVRCDSVDKIIALDIRNYTILDLCLQVIDKLNSAFPIVPPMFYAIEDTYNTKIVITVNGGHSFRIFTDQELRANHMGWNGEYYDPTNLKSANYVLANFGTSEYHTLDKPFISENINLQNLDYVLLCSNGLGYTSYGSREGERHIIKKIQLSNTYNELSSNLMFDIYDFIPVSKISLSRLKFHVSDPFGNIVNLHGSHISFSLIFFQPLQ